MHGVQDDQMHQRLSAEVGQCKAGVDQSCERWNVSGWFPVVFLFKYRPKKLLFHWEGKKGFYFCFSEDKSYKSRLLA